MLTHRRCSLKVARQEKGEELTWQSPGHYKQFGMIGEQDAYERQEDDGTGDTNRN